MSTQETTTCKHLREIISVSTEQEPPQDQPVQATVTVTNQPESPVPHPGVLSHSTTVLTTTNVETTAEAVHPSEPDQTKLASPSATRHQAKPQPSATLIPVGKTVTKTDPTVKTRSTGVQPDSTSPFTEQDSAPQPEPSHLKTKVLATKR